MTVRLNDIRKNKPNMKIVTPLGILTKSNS